MLNVLLKSETIVLEVLKVLTPQIVDEYYVCPAVMIELIKDNKYVMDGEEIVPASYKDVREARKKVKSFEWISHLKKFEELYPYWPMNHALPELAMPDQLLDFTKPGGPVIWRRRRALRRDADRHRAPDRLGVCLESSSDKYVLWGY